MSLAATVVGSCGPGAICLERVVQRSVFFVSVQSRSKDHFRTFLGTQHDEDLFHEVSEPAITCIRAQFVDIIFSMQMNRWAQ